jgi:peptidyl-prolyl cis-trans isomerase D
MLQWMRNAQTWVIKGVLLAVVLAFVVTIFYQWGVQSSGGPTHSEVATIFGQPVSIREFQSTYNALQQRYRAIFRMQPEVDLSEQFNFREMALEELAKRAILLRLAEQYGVVITQQELEDSIAEMAPFQEQGRFSLVRYQAVLRSQVPPIAPRQFEEQQRQMLLLQKVIALLTEGMHVTDAEVEQTYRHDNARVAVRYVTLTASSFEAQVSMTDEELQSYYEAHKEAYRDQEQRQIHYVAIPLQRFMQHYDPSAEEVNDYYTRHLETFQSPEQVRARHILFKVASSASAEQEAQARTRAEEALAALRNGEDFATLAKQHSEDTATAEQGGDLGYFPRGQMVAPFEEAAFSLPVGQLSDLIRTPFGWHILRVEDKREAETKPLAEVAPEIMDKIREDKARDAAVTFVDDLLGAIEANPQQFVTLAQQHELEVVTTPFIPATGSVEGLEGVPDLMKRVFAMPELGVDTQQGQDGTHYIFQPVAIRPSTIQPLSAVRDRVTQDLQRQKSMELARQQAEEWATQVRAGTPLATLAAAQSVEVMETGLFKRRDPVPQLGQQTDFSRVAFGLQVDDVGTAHDGTRHFVLQVMERQPADMQAYVADKAEYRQKLIDRKLQQAGAGFQQFLHAEYQKLRQQGDIVVNREYIF